MKPQQTYSCIRCLGALLVASQAELRCARCGRTFPVIDEIPVLTDRPHALVSVCRLALDRARADFDRVRSEIDAGPATSRGSPAIAERARRVLEGTAQNVTLVSRYMKPVVEYLKAHGERPLSAIDWIAAHAGGWRPESMLPYFYQDWGATSEFAAARALILEALLEHRPDRRALAVLGAGACGLVHAAAPHFDTTCGFDLSLPTVLIANGLLAGDSIVAHLESAAWRAVRLRGAPAATPHIFLAVADAAALPLATGSQSAVVTQYLLDLVGNPLAVAEEIARVLVPGGVWINFSTPFRVPAEPAALGPPALDEVPAIVEPFGFEVRARERRRFRLLDVTAIDPCAKAIVEDVHFFVATRTAGAEPAGGDAMLAAGHAGRHAAAFAQDVDDWWRHRLALMPGRRVRIGRRANVSRAGQPMIVDIEVSGATVSVPAPVAALLEALVSQLQRGPQSAADVFAGLAAAGMGIAAEEFRDLVAYLSRHHGVIAVERAREAVETTHLPCDLPTVPVLSIPPARG